MLMLACDNTESSLHYLARCSEAMRLRLPKDDQPAAPGVALTLTSVRSPQYPLQLQETRTRNKLVAVCVKKHSHLHKSGHRCWLQASQASAKQLARQLRYKARSAQSVQVLPVTLCCWQCGISSMAVSAGSSDDLLQPALAAAPHNAQSSGVGF